MNGYEKAKQTVQNLKSNLSEEDKEAINVLVEANITEHTLSTEVQPKALANQFKGVDIEGLEDIPMSMVAVPFCRLIQPTSKKTETSHGEEAPVGSFLFNDIQEAFMQLNIVLLRAKHEMRRIDENGKFVGADYLGETKVKPQVSILAITTDADKLFTLSLSSTSFSSFGKLIAELKALQVDKTYRFALNLTSEKKENDKGKYYIANFAIDRELSNEEMIPFEQKALEYGVVLDKQTVEEE